MWTRIGTILRYLKVLLEFCEGKGGFIDFILSSAALLFLGAREMLLRTVGEDTLRGIAELRLDFALDPDSLSSASTPKL